MAVDDDKHTLRTWFGLSESFDWRKRSYLGPLLFVVGVLVVGGLFTLAIAAAFKLLGSAVFGGLPQGAGSSFGLTGIIVAMIGAPFVVWRAVVAQKQVNVAEQGMITDRLNKAVEALGAERTINKLGRDISFSIGTNLHRHFEFQNEPFEVPHPVENLQRTAWVGYAINEPNLEMRIGAIYALERIARDSIRDHAQIVEILCAYIRQNAPCIELVPKTIPEQRVTPPLDIQTIITVLGRRSKEGKIKEFETKFRLDLRNCELSGVNFENGDFSAAMFHSTKFEGAILNSTKLIGTQMFSANLRFATFWDANLTGARLDEATVSPTNKFNSLNRAILRGTCLYGTDMSNVFMATALKKQ